MRKKPDFFYIDFFPFFYLFLQVNISFIKRKLKYTLWRPGISKFSMTSVGIYREGFEAGGAGPFCNAQCTVPVAWEPWTGFTSR